MKENEEGQLLRIFIGEDDTWEDQLLYEALVRRARSIGMAGATVFRGIEGYGSHSRIHTSKVFRLSEDLPVVVEIVDRKDKIDRYLEEIGGMIEEGLATVEKAQVIWYRPHRGED